MLTRRVLPNFNSLRYFSSGKVFTWGDYKSNLGREDYNTEPRFLPKLGENVTKVTMGPHHTLALTKEGKLYAFGDGSYGVLGNGRTDFKQSPGLVAFFESNREKIVDMDCGLNHTIALTENNTVYTWGRGDSRNFFTRPINESGNPLGIGESSSMYQPTRVTSLEGVKVKFVAAGDRHSTAITSDNRCFQWGTGFRE